MDDLRSNLAYVIQGIIGDELWVDADFEINGVGPASFKIADFLILNDGDKRISDELLTAAVDDYDGVVKSVQSAIAYIRDRIATGHFRSDYQIGELKACEEIEKAINGGGE
ncbi:hypothetical protein [Rhizobium sp. BK251]|uniref:hypothetical protein n=1 Tax=Rhizobium sp. BK251 TaxID=2512125 RepID=UPI0010539F04|nr:hypothetical protein [Rhizobium sp. BK251]TCL70597.1 hypothetical protein EV286_107474 [Rhizobium sp. BK251]